VPALAEIRPARAAAQVRAGPPSGLLVPQDLERFGVEGIAGLHGRYPSFPLYSGFRVCLAPLGPRGEELEVFDSARTISGESAR